MDRKSKMTIAFLIATLILLLFNQLAFTANQPEISWAAIGGGGGSSQMDGFSMDTTAGQALNGTTVNGLWRLCAGFWCGTEIGYLIHLPLINRDR
jgi:hypothetical protein